MKTNYRKVVAGFNRRSFLKGALAGGAAAIFAPRILRAAAPSTSPARPSGRVNLACIGIGGQGAGDVKTLAQTGIANIVALCDTDMGAPATQETLRAYPNVPKFQDFRKMFDRMGKDIDA